MPQASNLNEENLKALNQESSSLKRFLRDEEISNRKIIKPRRRNFHQSQGSVAMTEGLPTTKKPIENQSEPDFK